MNRPLTRDELKLTARLLDLAADKFSNHGCNDFDMEMSKEDAQPILIKRETWNGDEERVAELQDLANVTPDSDTDWYMMSYLAERIRRNTESKTSPGEQEMIAGDVRGMLMGIVDVISDGSDDPAMGMSALALAVHFLAEATNYSHEAFCKQLMGLKERESANGT